MKNLNKGHRERLKERFLKEGIDNFTQHQVLELILFFSLPYKDTNKIAHNLINKYGSISNVFEADFYNLLKEEGIGKHSASLLTLIPSLARKYFVDKWSDRPVLDSSSKAGNYGISLFAGETKESFYVICLNSQNKVNYAARLNDGTINEAPVYPREIVEIALRHQANSIVLMHNHPGGSTKPSKSDMEVTKKVIGVMTQISINVIDHIIVAGNQYFSFAEKGIL
mgnify:CR=1 FL=1